jgi:hypothetical protein
MLAANCGRLIEFRSPGFHAGGVFSGPNAASARPAKRYEGLAGASDMAANNAATSEVTRTPLPVASVAPKSVRA